VRAFVVAGLGLAAVAAAAIALNLVLLGYTSPPGEPVGNLSPAVPVKLVQKPVLKTPARGDERDD
jgi:hypothetical protein